MRDITKSRLKDAVKGFDAVVLTSDNPDMNSVVDPDSVKIVYDMPKDMRRHADKIGRYLKVYDPGCFMTPDDGIKILCRDRVKKGIDIINKNDRLVISDYPAATYLGLAMDSKIRIPYGDLRGKGIDSLAILDDSFARRIYLDYFYDIPLDDLGKFDDNDMMGLYTSGGFPFNYLRGKMGTFHFGLASNWFKPMPVFTHYNDFTDDFILGDFRDDYYYNNDTDDYRDYFNKNHRDLVYSDPYNKSGYHRYAYYLYKFVRKLDDGATFDDYKALLPNNH